MPIRPLYDRVVVRPGDANATASGIVIAGSANQTKGTVVAIGDGHVLEDGTQRPLTVKVGDVVLFNERAAEEIEVDGEPLLCFQEAALIGIVS